MDMTAKLLIEANAEGTGFEALVVCEVEDKNPEDIPAIIVARGKDLFEVSQNAADFIGAAIAEAEADKEYQWELEMLRGLLVGLPLLRSSCP